MNPIKLIADMTADLFHAGHVNFLRNARMYFDPDLVHLTVALHTDEQVFSYKGRYPVMDFDCRKEVLSSCVYVDAVMEAPDFFDENFIDPFDYLVHGDDLNNWEPQLVEQYYSKVKLTNKLLLVPYTEGISSTLLREKIVMKPK